MYRGGTCDEQMKHLEKEDMGRMNVGADTYLGTRITGFTGTKVQIAPFVPRIHINMRTHAHTHTHTGTHGHTQKHTHRPANRQHRHSAALWVELVADIYTHIYICMKYYLRVYNSFSVSFLHGIRVYQRRHQYTRSTFLAHW